jgi:hypothetical protein
MGSEVTPRPESELAGNRELCIGEPDRRCIRHWESGRVGETPASRWIAGTDRAEQFLRALTLLFQIESEGGVRVGRAGHADSPFACLRPHQAKEDDGSQRANRSWSWAQPFTRTWMLRPSAFILRGEGVAVNHIRNRGRRAFEALRAEGGLGVTLRLAPDRVAGQRLRVVQRITGFRA